LSCWALPAAAEKVTLVRAQAQTESHPPAEVPPARSAPLQPRDRPAYLLKEDFQQFWEYNSPTWAAMFLDFWCDQTMRSRIEPMKKMARTLRTHRALLLNYFKTRKQFSSGVIEGLNNKTKVTMRRS
jgi:transposase